MPRSKRESVALWSARVGVTALLEQLPTRPLLMVLNYHRIGDPEQTPYDPGTFSVTVGELDQQIACLKKRFDFITPEEAVSFAAGRARLRRTSVLITFDDGYLDNYTLAFPILRSHGVQGVFFLPTYFIGTGRLPWWDTIAYIVKHSRHRRIRLDYPESAVFDLDQEGLTSILLRILMLFKHPTTRDPERFLSNLEQACGTSRPGESAERCFLNWQEAQEMQNAGMAFGSHTHSHEILSKLPDEQQYEELVRSRQIIEEHLKRPVNTLAYPVGAPHTFSSGTASALRRANYHTAFSHYGGLNLPGRTNPFDIQRYPIFRESIHQLRLQTYLRAVTGRSWF